MNDKKRELVAIVVVAIVAMAVGLMLYKQQPETKPVTVTVTERVPQPIVVKETEIVKPENGRQAVEFLLDSGYLREEIPLPAYLQIAAHMAADEFKVPYEILLGLIEQETKFTNITGDSEQSFGYCQIQPQWWSGLMEQINADDLMDAEDNFRTCCAILKRSRDHGMTWEEAVAQYNPGNHDYAGMVLEKANRWKGVLAE